MADPTKSFAAPDPSQRIAGRFQILRPLGAGGMGEVFEAFDTELGQHIALKLIHPAIASYPDIAVRFKREVLLGRRVAHPNLCRLFDLGTHTDTSGRQLLFLTMELIPGATLAAAIPPTGVPLAAAEPLIRQIIAGLAALHEAGIVHRDFKPANVLLAPASGGPRAVITDFGLALDPSSSAPGLTATRAVIGTPDYMAPEQLLGLPVTPAADIFSLRVTLYRVFTGRLPFDHNSGYANAAKRLHEPPPPPASSSPASPRNGTTSSSAVLRPIPAAALPTALPSLLSSMAAHPAPFPLAAASPSPRSSSPPSSLVSLSPPFCEMRPPAPPSPTTIAASAC